MKRILALLIIVSSAIALNGSNNLLLARAASPAGGWQATSLVNAPVGRADHTAIWTGKEMIIWGGMDGTNALNSGGKYDPITNSWKPTSLTNAPTGQYGHVAIWTGKEMIIWGDNGGTNTGAKYNADTDSWRSISLIGAPAKRNRPAVVWTGTEMIVWGGEGGASHVFGDGAKYNPETDTWKPISMIGAPMARRYHKAVWTGTEMIIWGGSGFDEPTNSWPSPNTSARYNPSTDTWRPVSLSGAPPQKNLPNIVWSGNEMVVTGAEGYGGRYNPSSDTWQSVSSINAPSNEGFAGVVWTGREMIVWGDGSPSAGSRYNPTSNRWSLLTKVDAPLSSRRQLTAVWTGDQMIVWGGSDTAGSYVNTGGTYSTPVCTADNYVCGNWDVCSMNGQQTRTCNKVNECEGGVTPPPASQSCIYVAPVCFSWTYSSWGTCSEAGQQTRTIVGSSPSGCVGGSPVLSQSCIFIPACTEDKWSCGDWGLCSTFGSQTRICTKTSSCPTASTPTPATSQICTPPKIAMPNVAPPLSQQPTQPACFEDTWVCADWGSCSPQGIQTRSCKRTLDCPSVETPAPVTSQYCEAPTRLLPPPQEQTTQGESNQDSIVKATVKLVCPLIKKRGWVSVGSGTMIGPDGEILTNQHVIDGTPGCYVGFVDHIDDKPYFGEDKQIADIVKVSSYDDMALLKLRNPNNKSLTYVGINGNSVSNKLIGSNVRLYGYPTLAGSNLNRSSGELGGIEDDYLKINNTFIEHGNSGGGAYLNNGTFVGIPSKGARGEIGSIGFVLSINKINGWLNNSRVSFNSSGNNNYSRVSSIYEDIDLDNLKLFGISNATVAIYSDKSKSTLLPNNPGTIQTYNRPLFKISNVDSSGVVGYYVYFGANVKADPIKKGYFTKKSEFVPPSIKQKGTYYFILRAKDKSGSVSDAIITEYRYKK